jgi:hypothetical protein
LSVELITEEEVNSLPDGVAGFLGFERICRERLTSYLNDLGHNETEKPYRTSYCNCVAMAADEYGVDPGNLLNLARFNETHNGDVFVDFDGFDGAVRALVTRLQIQNARATRAGQLTLSQVDKTKIEHLVQVLRDRIAAEPKITDAKRKTLNKKLDELLENLRSNKVDLARTMIIVGGFFTAVSQGEGALIKLPETVGSIAKLVTLAKEYHDSLFPPPPEPKRITDQSKRALPTAPRESFSADLDDEIPF